MRSNTGDRRWQAFLLPIVLLPVLFASASAGDLALFEAVETRGEGDWDGVTLPSGATVYIARRPALVISMEDIAAVEVSQRPVYQDAQGSIDHEIRERFGKNAGKEPSSRPIGHYYVITFTLRAGASKQFDSFASQNIRRKFELRLDNRHVGYVFLLGPSGGNLLAVPVPHHDESALRVLLSPLASRVTWKNRSGSN